MSKPGSALSLLASARPAEAGERQLDFYCLRFDVWYSSLDCAVRTRFKTCTGCLQCDQGRFNLKRHEEALRGTRFPLPTGD